MKEPIQNQTVSAAPEAPRDRSLEHIEGSPSDIALALHNDAVKPRRSIEGKDEREPLVPEAPRETGDIVDLITVAKQIAAERDELQHVNQILRSKNDMLSARLASVTSAFLVLANDKSITGGARKLIEKECELLSTGQSGSHLFKELRDLRAERDRLLSECAEYEMAEHEACKEMEALREQVKELLAACKLLRLAFEQAVPASEMQDWWRDGWNQSGRAIANATATAGQAERRES